MMAGRRVRAPSHLSLINDQDIEEPQPTPPYRRIASSSHLRLDDPLADSPDIPVQSPPYKQYPSSSRINLGDTMDSSQTIELDVKKPAVHYPSSVNVRPTERASNSEDGPAGKPPSPAGTDDEDNEENYDWSTDEDLVDEEAKFEQKLGGEKPRKRWGPKRIATFFLSTLVGSTLLAGLIVAVPLILHFYYFIPNPTEHRRYITINVSAWLYWAAANLLLSWYLAMIVDIIPIICNPVLALVWGEVNEKVRSRIELYNAAKDKFKPVLYGASGWVSWIVIFDGIYNLYDRHNESNSLAKYTPRTYQGIQFLFFFTLVLCAEKMLLHIIAFAFHRKAFNDRLESLKHTLRVIDHLRDYRPKRHTARPSAHRAVFSFAGLGTTPAHEKSGFNFGLGTGEKQEFLHHGHKGRAVTPEVMSDDDGHAGDIEEGAGRGSHRSKKGKERRSWIFSSSSAPPSRQNTLDGLAEAAPADQPYQNHTYPPTPSPEHANSPRSGTTTPQPRHSNDEDAAIVVQAAKALKTAVLHDARNIKGKEDGPATLGWNVNSAHEAKRLARSIYTAFKVDRRRNYLIPSDFHPAYLKPEDAEDAFKVFDKDNNGDISRAEIKTTVLKVYKERRALSKSLRDVNNALKTLDWILIFFAMIILFFISLSVFDLGIGSSLTSFYTIGIAASFIFKNAASSAFDAVVFIFVTHPFDTGDRCFIDDENLVVKKMGLFATTFMRADGTETYYFNSQLFTKFITNVQRSGKMYENMTLQVAWRTPLEKLDQLDKCMNEWLATEENRWFEPSTAVTLQKIDYQRSLEFTMAMGHNGTWQDWGLRNTRKTAFLTAANFYCRQLGITFHNSPQPILVADTEEELTKVGLRFPDSNEYFAAPPSPGFGDAASDNANERDQEVFKQPVLGFLPPPDKRSTLTRVRKSKVRKANMRGMGGGGDG